MNLYNIEVFYEIYIIVFFTYLFYKILFAKIIYLDNYYINILKCTPIFWIINVYLQNIISLLLFVIYIVICTLIFAYSDKNIVVFTKKNSYISFLYDFFERKDINFKYKRNVYEVEIYLPGYEFEIISNTSLVKYFKIKLPKTVSGEEEALVNKIKKASRSKKLNPGRENAFYLLVIDIFLIMFFYYF